MRGLTIKFVRVTLAIGMASGVGMAAASDACFADPRVRTLISQSAALDECFASDKNRCLFGKMTVEEQRKVNAKRLVPFDRSKNALFDYAVGVVVAGNSEATGQRVSRCHVLTTGHMFHEAQMALGFVIKSPAELAQLNVRFHFGQTCDATVARHSVEAQIVFHMTEAQDLFCDKSLANRVCQIYGRSDGALLKLKSFDPANHLHFRIESDALTVPPAGRRVACWGFPGYNNQISLPKALSDQVLWYQTDAKVFPELWAQGRLTNATAYPGMSGGGCALMSDPLKLIGIFSDKGSVTGHAALHAPSSTRKGGPYNFLAPLDHLAQRYRQATGKRIEDLDKECD